MLTLFLLLPAAGALVLLLLPEDERIPPRTIALIFSGPVTVKGKPQLKMRNGGVAKCISGSGTNTLSFEQPSESDDSVVAVDLNGGAIIASEASVKLRPANLSLPKSKKK